MSEVIKKKPDPLDDANLERVTGGVTLLTGGWDCPGCKAAFETRRSPCPKCGYKS